MPRDRLAYLVFPVAAAIAVLPLILHGSSCGHDFDFHLLNWFEAAAQFRHGNLHPQWAFSPAWNAGEPRFVFYPPLSWTVGAILGLLMPWTWTPIVYTWLALTASGLAMHRLARAHAAPAAALIASTLYLANPYMLFTAYERTAYAELLAAAFLPLLFHAVLKPRPTITSIAIPLGLLWLTNAPAAVMGTYTLALLALIRLAKIVRSPAQVPMEVAPALRPQPNAWSFSLKITSGLLLGLSLAAFYILPAATERPLVQIAMATLPGLRVDDNTLFHHTGTTEDAIAHDAVLHTASLLAAILLTLTACALLVATANPRKSPALPKTRYSLSLSRLDPTDSFQSLLLGTLTILTVAIALLLTPISLPVWHHAPELAFLQFPWRLLAVLAICLALSTALALNRLQFRPIPAALAALTLATALTAAAYPNFHQTCDFADTVQARLSAFETHQGADPTDEYTPAAADNDSLRPQNPPFWLSPNPDAPPPANAIPAPAPQDLTVTPPAPEYIILNLRQYPAWHVFLNGQAIPPADLTRTPRADGLLTLPLPSGTDRLQITYRATPLEHAAEALSAFALLLALALLRRKRRPPLTW